MKKHIKREKLGNHFLTNNQYLTFLLLIVFSGIFPTAIAFISYRLFGAPYSPVFFITFCISAGLSCLGVYRAFFLPLTNVRRSLDLAEKGEYSYRLPITGSVDLISIEESFNKILDDLEKSDTSQRILISSVSHELRTPISIIRAKLENMADGIIEPSNEQLESLLSQVSNLSDLVSYLLDLSRLDADSTLLEKSVFGLEDFLLEAISPLKAYEGNKKLSFIVSVKPKNLKIEADRDRLQQIITNLAANAIKHSPPLSEIFLEGRRDGGQIVLSVIDSGIGIDKQDRKRVFKRFVQGKNASGGTGIGLAIVEWAVKLHGGSIEIKDSERGARFEVRLPSPQALHK